jgi:hypothetical protein
LAAGRRLNPSGTLAGHPAAAGKISGGGIAGGTGLPVPAGGAALSGNSRRPGGSSFRGKIQGFRCQGTEPKLAYRLNHPPGRQWTGAPLPPPSTTLVFTLPPKTHEPFSRLPQISISTSPLLRPVPGHCGNPAVQHGSCRKPKLATPMEPAAKTATPLTLSPLALPLSCRQPAAAGPSLTAVGTPDPRASLRTHRPAVATP